MKYIKILILSILISTPFLSKANFECSCTIGSESFGMKLTWFTVGADAGCANPTAGAALIEYMFQGQTTSTSYISSVDAGNLCSANLVFSVWSTFEDIIF
jgi:hypothetical protein